MKENFRLEKPFNISFPHRPGVGGPGSFQERIQKQFAHKGWRISYLTEGGKDSDVVFIVGGSKQLLKLLRMKLRGVPILYRLDGILWIHRKRWPGLKQYLLNEARNIIMKFTHAFIADHVVYQSEFVRRWWNERAWRRPKSESVIGNGVDFLEFSPEAAARMQSVAREYRRVICVEGSVDYSPHAIDLLNILAENLAEHGIAMEIYGGFTRPESLRGLKDSIQYHGLVSRREIVRAYQPGVYLSLDINAACPNTVIEAMSCGLPVVGFDTGALSELVPPDCGQIVEYGGDPWQLEMPNVHRLSEAIIEVIDGFETYSLNALSHARREFGIENVAARYTRLILDMSGAGVHPF